MPRDAQSPFTPGQPVPVEFFAGRQVEINELRARVQRSTAGRVQVCFLSGERGIGKSSLASFVKSLVEREGNILGLHVFLGGVDTLEEATRRIFDRLLKETEQAFWFNKIRDLFGDHVRKVGLFGVSVEFDASAKDLRWLANNFAEALHSLSSRLKGEKDSTLLILDDINGLAASQQFANWLKSLVDEIAVSDFRLPLCLLLVGLPERREELLTLQPSLSRVFEPIEIHPWSDAECAEFFSAAFRRAGVEVAESALEMFVYYSGGMPVLAHELGDVAFLLDDDGYIDVKEAAKAVVETGAVVGRKYLRPQVFAAIRSERYRTILKTFGAQETVPLEFSRSGLQARLDPDEQRVVDNFLRRMEGLGVIKKAPDRGPGVYRFVNRLHAVYFWFAGREPTRRGQQASGNAHSGR